MEARYRVRKGDQILLVPITSTAVTLFGWVRGITDNGKLWEVFLPDFTTAGTRTQELIKGEPRIPDDGYVSDASILFRGAGPKRGQAYVQLLVAVSGEDVASVRSTLAQGYVYGGHVVVLGENVEPGPGGGEGAQVIELISSSDNAGNVATTSTIPLANTIRKLRGFIIYYDCAAVAATRTVQIRVRRPFGVPPTGFAATSAAAIVWDSPTVTLTTGEEGTIFAYNDGRGDGFVGVNDNGTVTYASTDTAPLPFPILLGESGNDALVLLTNIGAGEATDVYNLYALYEEWLVI